MHNILQYFNSLTNLIFGPNNNFFYLMTPTNCFNYLSTFSASSSSIEQFLLSLLGQPALIFSLVVWLWFFVLVFKLLLVYPFNWIRSVIRKCKG